MHHNGKVNFELTTSVQGFGQIKASFEPADKFFLYDQFDLFA